MLRTSLIVGATLATLATPALAASGWNLIVNAPSGAAPGFKTSVCSVVDRPAAMGEMRVAGPFKTESEGLAAIKTHPACIAPNY